MQNEKNKKKIFKRIGAIVVAFAVAIVAFSLPFLGKFDSKINARNMIAYADETITTATEFNGSTYAFSVGAAIKPVGYTSNVDGYGFLNSSFDIFSNNGDITLKYNVYDFNFYYLRYNEPSIFFRGNVGSPLSSPSYSFSYDLIPNTLITVTPTLTSGSDFSLFYTLRFSMDAGFTPDIVSFRIYSETVGDFFSTYVIYTSSSGASLSIEFYSGLNGFNINLIPGCPIYYSDRTYFLVKDLTDNEYYNQGYANGSSAGYSSGYAEGEAAGYRDGYGVGNGVGYNNGYSDGVEAGGNYTFFSLISAVIDAPVQAFMGLFNFELLGVNLAGFFTGLLTLAFIVTVVRLIL